MPVRLLRPYNGQNANTLYVGTDEAILRAIGIADDYIENATNFVPFASQAFRAFASSFSTGSPAGSFITSFSNPFAGQGRGITTYTLTGTVPPQVALSATGRSLVVGSTAAVAGTIYSVNVTATSGDGLLTTQPATLSFMAMAQLPLVAGGGGTPGPAPTPTPTPTPTPSPTLNALTVSSGSGTVGSVLSSTISGLTSGSSLSLSGAGAPGLSISGAVINGTPTTVGVVNIVETLAGATNSPRTTSGAITVSAGSAIVAPARYVAFADDFEGSPALLSTRPNWSDLGTGLLNKWSISDGFVYNNNLFQARNTIALGTQTADFIATIGYDFTGTKPTGNTDTDAWSANQQNFRFWHKDESNFLSAQLDPATGGGRISIGGKVGGTDVSQQYFYVTFPASKKGELVFEMRGGILRIRLDGKWVSKGPRNAYPFDIADVTGGFPQANRSGYNGIYGGTYRWAQAQSYAVTPLDVTIDFVNDAVGHDVLGGLVGTADIRGTYTGTPTRWIYRVLNYNTLVVVQDWRDITANTANGAAGLPTTTASGASFAGTISLPDGGPYSIEAGYIGSDGFRHTSYSMGTMCGARVMYYGQSNSTSRVGQSYVPVTFADQATARADMISSIPDGMFASTTRPYAFPGSYGLANQAATILGKPVVVDVRGVPAQSIEYLSPGGAGWQMFLDGVSATRGVIELVIWDQGENNADGAFYPTTYSDTFRNTLLPGLRSATGNPNLKVLISPVGRYASSVPPNSPNYPAATIDAQRETLRQQYLDIISKEPNVGFAGTKLGCSHGADPYHYPGVAYAEMGRREAWTVAKVLGAAVHDGLGPKVTSATRSGAVVTLAVNLNGAISITGPTNVATGTVPTPTLGNALYGFQVSKDGFNATLPISNMVVSGSNLVITLSSDPGAAVSVRSHYGWSYDDTNTFNGTYSDTTPIPVFPIMTALTTPS